MKKSILILSLFASTILFAIENPEPCKSTKYIYTIKSYGVYQVGTGGRGNGGPVCAPHPTQVCVLIRTEVPDAFIPSQITYAEWYNPDLDTYESISRITRTNLANGAYKLNFTYGPVWVGPFGLLPSQYTVTP